MSNFLLRQSRFLFLFPILLFVEFCNTLTTNFIASFLFEKGQQSIIFYIERGEVIAVTIFDGNKLQFVSIGDSFLLKNTKERVLGCRL